MGSDVTLNDPGAMSFTAFRGIHNYSVKFKALGPMCNSISWCFCRTCTGQARSDHHVARRRTAVPTDIFRQATGHTNLALRQQRMRRFQRLNISRC
jgi:hypothetical protein